MNGGVMRIQTKLRPTDSPSAIYAQMAEVVPAETMLALGPGIFRELRQELHSVDAVLMWAADLAQKLSRPVSINIPAGDGSHTVTLAPGWSEERLAGYIAGRHEELEDLFGPISRVRGPIKE